MTALVTLEQRPLRPGEQGPAITITAQDVRDYRSQVLQGGSTVPVVEGEQLTEYQALEALLLPSANNVAIVLARWISGSVAAFVGIMNARASALGLRQTTFADPSGFDPATVSVPADLVRLGQQAMTDPVFARIVAEQQVVIPVAGTISNVNAVLGHDGIVGVKTGNSDQARAVYMAAATYDLAAGPPTLVFVVVQGLATLSDCFAAAQRLVDAVKSALQLHSIVTRGEVLGWYSTAWGLGSRVVAGADLRVLLWPGTGVTAELRAPGLRAPARAGSLVGTLHVSVGDRDAAVPAVLPAGLAGPGGLWRVTRSVAISTLPPMGLLTWLSLALAVAALLLALTALMRAELQGPNVGLRLVSRPSPDAWRVSRTPRLELSGMCVGLLTNSGSHAGAAWDFRVTARTAEATRPVLATVLPAHLATPAGDAGAAGPDVIQIDPKSSTGLLVRLRLPLEGPNVEAALAALRRPSGDLRVSLGCGATRWPWGRTGRRSSAVVVPRGELVAALERWAASRPSGPIPAGRGQAAGGSSPVSKPAAGEASPRATQAGRAAGPAQEGDPRSSGDSGHAGRQGSAPGEEARTVEPSRDRHQAGEPGTDGEPAKTDGTAATAAPGQPDRRPGIDRQASRDQPAKSDR